MKLQKWEPETQGIILRRMGKTGEELAELSKVLNRIVIQGYKGKDPATGVSNEASLEAEIADVYAQLDETVERLNLDAVHIQKRRATKRGQMAEWENFFGLEQKEGA